MSLGKRSLRELYDEDLIAYEQPFPPAKRTKTAMEDIVMRPYRARRYPASVLRRGIRKSYRSRLYRRRRPFVPRYAYKSEFKYIDTGLINITSDTTGAIQLINGSAEGVGPTQHVGRRTLMKSVELKLRNSVVAGTGTDQTYRVMLVYDRQPNGVALTIAEVLNAVSVMSMKNLDNRMRFTVLLDKIGTLNATGEPGADESWNYYKMLNMPVVYDATADATIASISTGSLYLISIGSNVAGNTAGTLQGYARVRYTDN